MESADRGTHLSVVTGAKRLPGPQAEPDERLLALTLPLLQRLAGPGGKTMVAPQRPDFSVNFKYSNGQRRTVKLANQSGGFTMPYSDDKFSVLDVRFFESVHPSNALVFLDNSGTTYTLPGEGTRVADPTFLILWHELFHADEITRGTALLRDRSVDEGPAVAWENQIREQLGLGKRSR